MILIGIHGYSGDGERTKSREEVTIDRCKKAEEVANKYNEISDRAVKIVYLGNSIKSDTVAAEYTKEVSKENTNIVDNYETIICDEHGENTQAEIDSLISLSDRLEPDLVISVSSQDHTPRIQRIYTSIENKPYITSVVSSEDKYAKSDQDPFILEGRYSNLVESLNNILGISMDKETEIADEIGELIEKYKNK